MWITSKNKNSEPNNQTQPKTFDYYKRAYFKDTNLFGIVYFAQYFLWQGEAREAFLLSVIPECQEMFNKGPKMITALCSMQFKRETLVFDEITISVCITAIGHSFMDLEFIFKKQDELVGIGTQKIVFADKFNKLQPVPEIIRQKALEHGFIKP